MADRVWDEIIDLVSGLTQGAGPRPVESGVPGLSVIAGDIPAHQLAALYQPIIGLTIQGTKVLSVGERTTALKGPCYYVLPVHVPATAKVHPEKDGRPYLSLGLSIDHSILQSLLRDLPQSQLPTTSQPFSACELDREFKEAWLRLLKLTQTPQDIPALAPVYTREILYRVLMGPQGAYLRQLGMKEGILSRIAKVVIWIRDNYEKSIDVEKLASSLGMAVNTFHRQFKSATGLSPIQFQKQLRLIEARNLIVFEGLAVSSAAYQVGYQSPSQFNREYSRFFGAPPAKDAAKLKLVSSVDRSFEAR